KTNGPQDGGQSTTAVATPPAIHQGFPVTWLVNGLALDMGRDVACGKGRAALLGLEGVDLLVVGANSDALGVVQRGPVDGARDVIERVFVLAACVDGGGKAFELAKCLGG